MDEDLENIKIFIAANKIDKFPTGYLIPSEIKKFALNINASIHKVSAKLNRGLNELFYNIADDIIKLNIPQSPTKNISLSSTSHSLTIKNKSIIMKKSGCCE